MHVSVRKPGENALSVAINYRCGIAYPRCYASLRSPCEALHLFIVFGQAAFGRFFVEGRQVMTRLFHNFYNLVE